MSTKSTGQLVAFATVSILLATVGVSCASEPRRVIQVQDRARPSNDTLARLCVNFGRGDYSQPAVDVYMNEVPDDEDMILWDGDGNIYMAGSQGPCGPGMNFYHQNWDPQRKHCGICDCTQGWDNRKRPHVYVPWRDGCYPLYHRGPCRRGQWLVVSGSADNYRVMCERNRCPPRRRDPAPFSDPNSHRYLFYHAVHRRCYATYTRGFCDNNDSQLVPDRNAKYPKCDFVQSPISETDNHYPTMPPPPAAVPSYIASYGGCKFGSKYPPGSRTCRRTAGSGAPVG